MSPSPVGRDHSRTDSRPGRRWGRVLALLVWLPIAAVVVLPCVHTFTELSHIDEFQHVDYLVKTQQLEHVNAGERVGRVAMREQACRGMDLEGVPLPPCSKKRLSPEEFPGAGFNHTFADPPTYYVITGALAAGLQRLPGADSVVTAGRSVGVLWLAGGLVVTYLLGRRLGAGPVAAAGATLLIGCTPAVVLSVTTVTTDAPQLVVGGLLCLLALAVVSGRSAWWWLAPAAALATAFKITSLSVIGAVSVFLLVSAISAGRPTNDRTATAATHDVAPGPRLATRTAVLAVAAMLVAAAVPVLAWQMLTTATALPSVDDIPMGQEFKVPRLTWAALSDSVPRVFSPVRIPDAPDAMKSPTVILAYRATNLLLILGCAGLAWFGGRDLVARGMGLATTLAMLLSGPVFLVLVFVTMQVSYWIPGRYGLGLLPAAAACLAVTADRHRFGGPALLGLGAAGLVALLAQTV